MNYTDSRFNYAVKQKNKATKIFTDAKSLLESSIG